MTCASLENTRAPLDDDETPRRFSGGTWVAGARWELEKGRAAMKDDERAIRELVDTWMAATRSGDADKVMSLMADDVVFMVPVESHSARRPSRAPPEK